MLMYYLGLEVKILDQVSSVYFVVYGTGSALVGLQICIGWSESSFFSNNKYQNLTC